MTQAAVQHPPTCPCRDREILAALIAYQQEEIRRRLEGPWRPGLQAPIDFYLGTMRMALGDAAKDVTDRHLRAAADRLVGAAELKPHGGKKRGAVQFRTALFWRLAR